MSGWPSLDRVDDERLALSLAAGDPNALPQIVDRYAARLYDYCHALLRDQESAAGALHDALLAAAAHIGLLREPARFRGWLYALVRNECLRRLRDPDRPAERHEAPEVEDSFLDAAERAQRLETRRLVHSALSGLRGREREALDLQMRHGLDAADIGGVLGVGAQDATDLAGAARRRLDDALAAALIARTGREECPSVAALIGGADRGARGVAPPREALSDGGEQPLTPAVSRKLVRHIETCPTCTERRDRTVSTARLLQVLPVALMPAELRYRVLGDATDQEFAVAFAEIARRAEPFDTWGWPMPLEPATAGQEGHRRNAPPRLWPAIAAAAAVILVVAGAFWMMPDSPKEPTAAQKPPGASAVADPSDPASVSPEPSESRAPTESPTPTPTPTTSSPTPKPTRLKPTRTPKPPASSRPPAPGRLAVDGCTITAQQSSCTISVRAVGGPVSWSVTGAAGVSAGGAGRLGAGGSTGVRASRIGPCSDDGGSGTVSFAPGGTAEVFWECGS